MAGAEDLVQVRLVADGDTPAEIASEWGGKVLAVDPTVRVPEAGVLMGLYGWGRVAADGRREWVLTGAADRVAEFVDTIPGAGGWAVPESRTVYLATARALLAAGVTRAAVRSRLPLLYSAAVTNHTANG